MTPYNLLMTPKSQSMGVMKFHALDNSHQVYRCYIYIYIYILSMTVAVVGVII